MQKEQVLVYGAGGHAKVVIDILEGSDRYELVGVLDDAPALAGRDFCGYRVLGGLDYLLAHRHESGIILAIGDNGARERLARRLEPLGWHFITAIHPTATIGRDVRLGEGTVLMAHAAVNPGTTIGQHVIINTGATVDHDCSIGDFAHISPGAHLAGGVTVEPLAHVGIGATVIDGITIGAGSIVGAGAAVVTDIPPGVVAVGVPARVVKNVDRE